MVTHIQRKIERILSKEELNKLFDEKEVLISYIRRKGINYELIGYLKKIS